MPEYRRFIAYFYEYINGKKQKNAGFAKVELRMGIWRLLFRLTTDTAPGAPVRVYGFVRKDGYLLGIPMGTMQAKREMAEEWAYRADAPVAKNYRFEDFAGIWVRSADDRCFLTVWDEEAVDVEKLVLEIPQRGENAGGPAEAAPGITESGGIMPGQGESGEVTPGAMVSREAESDGQTSGEAMPEQAKSGGLPPGGAESVELTPGAMVSGEASFGETESGKRMPGQGESVELTLGGEISEEMAHEEMVSGEAMPEQAESGEMTLGGAESRKMTPGAVVSGEEESGRQISGKMTPGAMASGETESGQQISGNVQRSAAQREQKSGAAGDPVVGYELGADRNKNGRARRDIVGELMGKRQQFCPSENAEFSSCVMIMPCDIVRMQQEGWQVGRSSFLQHGFYQHRHLLLCRKRDGTYLLGVPGMRTPQEQYMAELFGFPDFMVSRVCECRKVFGYWCRPLQMRTE